jgi:hypothetical protein
VRCRAGTAGRVGCEPWTGASPVRGRVRAVPVRRCREHANTRRPGRGCSGDPMDRRTVPLSTTSRQPAVGRRASATGDTARRISRVRTAVRTTLVRSCELVGSTVASVAASVLASPTRHPHGPQLEARTFPTSERGTDWSTVRPPRGRPATGRLPHRERSATVPTSVVCLRAHGRPHDLRRGGSRGRRAVLRRRAPVDRATGPSTALVRAGAPLRGGWECQQWRT